MTTITVTDAELQELFNALHDMDPSRCDNKEAWLTVMDKVDKAGNFFDDDDNIYVIDDGDTFEGDISQFRDCFFSNATEPLIKDWCREQNCKLEIRSKNGSR